MAISIYLDTNVYLSFYHFTSDDLQELEKLLALIKNKEVILYLPQQTKDEYNRSRENKINEAIKKIRENELNSSFPQICKDFKEHYKNIKDSLKNYEKSRQAIINMIISNANKKTLSADKTISKLFKKAIEIKNTPELIEKAKLRFDLGNPPGKNKSYGDALNWESLLSKVETFEEFYFISDDKDYYSVLDKEKFNPFLLDEWENKINSEIKYYKRLSQFFKEKYPEITIASEYEKDTLINKLANSSTFASTHSIIRSLREFDSFTDKQINDIVYSAISNNQIYWISEDAQIKRFMQEIYDDFNDIIEEEYLDDFIEYYKLKTSD